MNILLSHFGSDTQNWWVQLEHPLRSSSLNTAFTDRLTITQPRSTDNPKQAKVPLLLTVGTVKASQSSRQNVEQVFSSKRNAAPLKESLPFLTAICFFFTMLELPFTSVLLHGGGKKKRKK